MRRTPMRRTGFTGNNWTPPERTERTLTPIRALTPSIAREFEPAFKIAPLRSEQYRRYVASFPCMRCGLAGSSQCAHANKGKGMAMKTCDRRTFPACFKCHSDIDNTRGMTREQRRALEDEYVDLMQEIARRDGRQEFR